MHCLVITIFYCVDNHFTSFVANLLLLTMVYNVQYMGKQLVMYIGLAIGIRFFLTMNIGYWKMEKIDIGTPLVIII